MGGCPFSGAGAGETVSRRRILAGAAGLAALPVLAGVAGTAQAAVPAPIPTPAPTTASAPTSAALTKLKKGRALKGAHGVGDPRGCDIALRAGRTTEARFGVMFKTLPAYNPPDALLSALAVKMNDGKQPLNDVKDSDVAFDNPGIPAGFVYFGQFVDHDMTHDTTPLTQQKQDPRGMVNFDSPKFDLDSVYGKGPAANPELYDPGKPGYLLSTSTTSCSTCPATPSVRPTSATRATTRTSSSRSCTRSSCGCTTSRWTPARPSSRPSSRCAGPTST